MKIVVSRQELLAAALFVSNDESRHVLNGVSIEILEGNEKPLIVATDGRRLVVLESLAEQKEELTDKGRTYFDENHAILLRADFLKIITQLSKAAGGKLMPWICFENKKFSDRLEVSIVGAPVFLAIDKGAFIEGTYPNWRASVPAKNLLREPINEIGLNAEYVGDFGKAAKILEATSPAIQMNLVGKEGAIELKLSGLPAFYGLLMQCKLQDEVEYQPEFLDIVRDLPARPESQAEEPEEDLSAAEAIEEGDGLTKVSDALQIAERSETEGEEVPA
jgi:hypothetical protein